MPLAQSLNAKYIDTASVQEMPLDVARKVRTATMHRITFSDTTKGNHFRQRFEMGARIPGPANGDSCLK